MSRPEVNHQEAHIPATRSKGMICLRSDDGNSSLDLFLTRFKSAGNTMAGVKKNAGVIKYAL